MIVPSPARVPRWFSPRTGRRPVACPAPIAGSCCAWPPAVTGSTCPAWITIWRGRNLRAADLLVRHSHWLKLRTKSWPAELACLPHDCVAGNLLLAAASDGKALCRLRPAWQHVAHGPDQRTVGVSLHGRGHEPVNGSLGLLGMAPYGRGEAWEDKPRRAGPRGVARAGSGARTRTGTPPGARPAAPCRMDPPRRAPVETLGRHDHHH